MVVSIFKVAQKRGGQSTYMKLRDMHPNRSYFCITYDGKLPDLYLVFGFTIKHVQYSCRTIGQRKDFGRQYQLPRAMKLLNFRCRICMIL